MGASGGHRLTTAQRGLGNRHKTAAAGLKARHIDGSPCGWCTEPMFIAQGLHADHSVPRSLVGGTLPDRLLHSWCNEERRGVPYLSRAEWVASKRHGNTDRGSDLGKRALRWP